MEDYYDDAEMLGSWLKIGFHGDRKTSEQTFIIILFREGENVGYFVVRGVSEGDRRVTRYDMVRVMDWIN